MSSPRAGAPPGHWHGREWMRLAACASPLVDADALFFPVNHLARNRREHEAKAVCARCTVLEECRALVDRLEARQEQVGVWAGENESERRARRRSTTGSMSELAENPR